MGSSTVITDSTGAKVQTLTYYPYGATRTNQSFTTPAVDVPYKYTGKELDSTGLYYYEARYYDPQLGRFISADTIVPKPNDPQEFNRYSYAGNNPLLYTDPTGHFKIGKFFKRAFGDMGTAIIGVAIQAFTGGIIGPHMAILGGGAVLTQSKSGRYVLASEIVVGTAAAAVACTVATGGGCGAAAPAIYGAAIGASSGGALGGYSASRNGGDLSSGILVGSGIGAATGALTGYVNGAMQAPALGGWSDFVSPQYLAEAGKYLGANIAAGTVLNAGSGAVAAYAGGKGSFDHIVSGSLRSAGKGLGQESLLDVIGLVYGGIGAAGGFTIQQGTADYMLGDSDGNFRMVSGDMSALRVAEADGNLGRSIKIIQTINNSYVAPDGYNYAHGVK